MLADIEELETWADIAGDDAAIIACGERWKQVAAIVGCTLHGFNDGRGATFLTPDGTTIEVGPRFRIALQAFRAQEPPADVAKLVRDLELVAEGVLETRDFGASAFIVRQAATTITAQAAREARYREALERIKAMAVIGEIADIAIEALEGSVDRG